MVKIPSYGIKNIHTLIRCLFKISLSYFEKSRPSRHHPQIPWWKIRFRPSSKNLLLYRPTFCKNLNPPRRQHTPKLFKIFNKRKNLDLRSHPAENNFLRAKNSRIQISLCPNLHVMGTSINMLWQAKTNAYEIQARERKWPWELGRFFKFHSQLCTYEVWKAYAILV